jgi:hypothetical protein
MNIFEISYLCDQDHAVVGLDLDWKILLDDCDECSS